MSISFDLVLFDPLPTSHVGVLDGVKPATSDIMALDIQCKYLFVDEAGQPFHEYPLPTSADIHNCGGYVDKVIMYRNPALLEYLQTHQVSKSSLNTSPFPILATRSPQLDLTLFEMIRHLRSEGLNRVSLFDQGCTVGEHWDLLNTMIRASSASKDDAAHVLSYCGLDKSAMLLSIARLLHMDVAPEHFRLINAEGSDLGSYHGEFDLSLSVGVINHIAQPHSTLQRIIRSTRYAFVLAVWVTLEPHGFWSIIHSGLPFYFFSIEELLQMNEQGGRFFVLDFIPERFNSQEKSFIGMGAERMAHLGCYHLLYTRLSQLPFEASILTHQTII